MQGDQEQELVTSRLRVPCLDFTEGIPLVVSSGQVGLCNRGPTPMGLPSPDQVILLGMVVLKPAPAMVTLVQLHTPLPPVTLLKKSDPSGFSAATCEPDVRVGVGQVLSLGGGYLADTVGS